jgi:hypothetical protein
MFSQLQGVMLLAKINNCSTCILLGTSTTMKLYTYCDGLSPLSSLSSPKIEDKRIDGLKGRTILHITLYNERIDID